MLPAYADTPPPGYVLRPFRGGVACLGDMAFHEGRWQCVQAGQNIAGADAASLWYSGVVAIARPKSKPVEGSHRDDR